MRIAALRERIEGERRVAITPESARQLVDAGLVVTIESGAGAESGYADAAYQAAGAEVVRTLRPGQAITKEFRVGRLNLVLDADGRIASAHGLRSASSPNSAAAAAAEPRRIRRPSRATRTAP